MSTTIGCPIPGASQPKDPVRLVDANGILRSVGMSGCGYEGSEYQAYKAGVEYVRGLVDDEPTVDPESLRPTAHWLSDSSGSTNVVCSACNAISFAAYNFCPECGKRMVSADD